MAEETTTTTQEPTQGQAAQGDPQGTQGTDWKAEARKWEERAKADHARLADYEALKEKAAKYDELAEANKSDIERANDAAAKAKADADEWRARFEELDAARKRDESVRSMASQYGVDADTLGRMAGDVEENARFLQAKEAARPKFGPMHDGGEQAAPTQTLEERLAKAKNQQERISIRAEVNARKRSNR